MNDAGDNIIQVFSSSFELISKQETCDEFIAEYQIGALNLSSSENNVIDKINLRDQVAIHFFETEEIDSIDYLSSNTNSWSDFISELNVVLNKL